MAAAVDQDAEPPKGRRGWRLPEALPALGPVAMRVYVVLWSLLLVVAIVMPVLNVYFNMEVRQAPTWSAVGFRADSFGGIVQVNTPEAEAAGLRVGDRILAVEGTPVSAGPDGAQAARLRMLGPDGSRKRLLVRSPGASPREIVLVRQSDNAELPYRAVGLSGAFVDWFIAANGLLTSLALIAAAVLLFRRRRQPVAAWLSLGYLAVTAFATYGGAAATPLGVRGLTVPLASFGWTCVLLALLTMPDGRFKPRWSLAIAGGIVTWAVADALWHLSLAWNYTIGLAMIPLTVGTLAVRYRGLPPSAERQQLRWSFLGFTIGTSSLMAGLVLEIMAPGDIWALLIASLCFTIGLSAWALGMMVSLLRYRLYDADAVIGRSAGYAVLTLLLAGTFGASAKLIEWVFEIGFGEEAGALPGAIGAGLAVVLITPLNGRVQRWAEGRFRKGLIALKTEIPDAAGDLRENASLAELLDEMLARVNAGVRATRSAIVIDGGRAAQRGEDADLGAYPLAVPLRSGEAGPEVATLLVGPRPDGTPPGKDERGVLNDIAAPIARAIQVVRRREAREAALDRRFAEMERRIQVLGVPKTRVPSGA